MNILETKNIHKYFGTGELRSHILKGINLSIAAGEFVSIIGKSGAGKSTLLYQLSTLDSPTEGTIIFEGVATTDLTEDELEDFRLHTLGYVFQDYALIPDLNASENVALPLLMRGIEYKEALEIAEAGLATVDLRDKSTNFPSQLSGGEQQRVAIARAIAGKPKILFADEPTANLDSRSGQAVIDLLGALHKQGQTIVMVTHEQEYTLGCDRIIHMEDGQVTKEERLQ